MDLSPIVDHAYLLNVTPDQHHPQAHSLASHSTKAHTELTGVTTAQHHTKYTNAEALAAAQAGSPFTHAGDVGIGISPAAHLHIKSTVPTEDTEWTAIIDRNGISSPMSSVMGIKLAFDLADVPLRSAGIAAIAEASWANLVGLGLFTGSSIEYTEKVRINSAGNVAILVGNLTLADTKTVDGVDISAHAANANAHHPQAHTLASHSTKAHTELTGVTTSQHHVKTVAGDLNLADMAEKSHASLTNVTANQHHNQAHTLASHSTKAHTELTGVTTAQHHAKYTNAEALAAAEAETTFEHAGGVWIKSEGAGLFDHAIIQSSSSVAYQGGLLLTNSPITPTHYSFKISPSYCSSPTSRGVKMGWIANDDPQTWLNLISIDRDGDISVPGTVDGVDIAAHAANVSAHHTKFTTTEHDTTVRHPVAVIKTSVGSAAGTYPNLTGGNITFNRKSFFPQMTSDNELWVLTALAASNPNDYIGRIGLWNDSGGSVDYWLQWDYLS